MTKCVSCGEEMQKAKRISFRIGGLDGGLAWVFPGFSHLDEQTLELDMLFCPKCGRIDMFADEKAQGFLTHTAFRSYGSKEEYRKSLASTPKKYLKKCRKCNEEIPLAAEKCPLCGAGQN